METKCHKYKNDIIIFICMLDLYTSTHFIFTSLRKYKKNKYTSTPFKNEYVNVFSQTQRTNIDHTVIFVFTK